MNETGYAFDDKPALRVVGSEVSMVAEGTVKVHNASSA
jgi:hypothetical protein